MWLMAWGFPTGTIAIVPFGGRPRGFPAQAIYTQSIWKLGATARVFYLNLNVFQSQKHSFSATKIAFLLNQNIPL